MSTRPKPIFVDTRVLDLALVAALALGLVSGAFWYAGRPSAAAPPATPPPALTLSLSGAVTTDMRLAERDLAEVRCTPAGFHVAASPDLSPFAFTLSFRGVPGAARAAAYVLGAGVGPLALRLNTLDASGKSTPGPVFRSLEGNVTVQGATRRFTALVVDDLSRPLYVSGLLRCP